MPVICKHKISRSVVRRNPSQPDAADNPAPERIMMFLEEARILLKASLSAEGAMSRVWTRIRSGSSKVGGKSYTSKRTLPILRWCSAWDILCTVDSLLTSLTAFPENLETNEKQLFA